MKSGGRLLQFRQETSIFYLIHRNMKIKINKLKICLILIVNVNTFSSYSGKILFEAFREKSLRNVFGL
jgi:hypothetical protein